jgi:hypothetical protein
MPNEVKAPPKVTTKSKSDLLTLNDLLPHIDGARQSSDPIRQTAVKELASMAASTLGAMPKREPKRWTGWIGKTHFWRGRRVVLRNGVVAEVFGVVRGLAAISWSDPHWIENVRHDVLPVDELIVYKTPAAVVLGKLKLGRKEEKSLCKQISCRLNGARPVRPGHRPRGRPRKAQATASASMITGLDSGNQYPGPVVLPPWPSTPSP